MRDIMTHRSDTCSNFSKHTHTIRQEFGQQQRKKSQV